jgi:tetratricopeptide (TPR) repeat protein
MPAMGLRAPAKTWPAAGSAKISSLRFGRRAGTLTAFMDAERQKSEALYEFLAWLEVNKKRVAVGAAVVAIVIGVAWIARWYGAEKERKAGQALSAISLQPGPTEPVPADTADKLLKVAAEYPGTLAAIRAELIRASLLFTGGKYAEAEGAFSKFIREHPESRWVGQAYFGAAVSLDAQNKVNDAISKYEDFARRFSNDPNIDQARLNLGVLYEVANKPAEAAKEYDKIVKSASSASSMGYSPAQGEAQERQRRLLAKHPELAPVPTNRPPSTVALPAVPGTGAVSTVRSNLAPGTNVPFIIKPAPPAASPAAPAVPKK